MEQLVARWAHNPKAVGSSPAPATTKALVKTRAFFYDQIYFYLIFPTEFFAVSCLVLAATTLYVFFSTRRPKNT